MSIFKKTGYIRVLTLGLPFGIGCLIVGIPLFKEIPNNDKELIMHEGFLSSFGETDYYSKKADNERNVFCIKIGDSTFYTDRRKEREIIESYNYQIGDSIKVWTDSNDVLIRQLFVNNKIIMRYEPPYWMAWFFTLAGIFFTIMLIYYLIKYFSDLFGGEESMDDK